MKWQTIDTAPKDETHVLVRWKPSANVRICVYRDLRWRDPDTWHAYRTPDYWHPLPPFTEPPEPTP
jgi:hypothetical protein